MFFSTSDLIGSHRTPGLPLVSDVMSSSVEDFCFPSGWPCPPQLQDPVSLARPSVTLHPAQHRPRFWVLWTTCPTILIGDDNPPSSPEGKLHDGMFYQPAASVARPPRPHSRGQTCCRLVSRKGACDSWHRGAGVGVCTGSPWGLCPNLAHQTPQELPSTSLILWSGAMAHLP